MKKRTKEKKYIEEKEDSEDLQTIADIYENIYKHIETIYKTFTVVEYNADNAIKRIIALEKKIDSLTNAQPSTNLIDNEPIDKKYKAAKKSAAKRSAKK